MYWLNWDQFFYSKWWWGATFLYVAEFSCLTFGLRCSLSFSLLPISLLSFLIGNGLTYYIIMVLFNENNKTNYYYKLLYYNDEASKCTPSSLEWSQDSSRWKPPLRAIMFIRNPLLWPEWLLLFMFPSVDLLLLFDAKHSDLEVHFPVEALVYCLAQALPGLVVRLWPLSCVGMGLYPNQVGSVYEGMSSLYIETVHPFPTLGLKHIKEDANAIRSKVHTICNQALRIKGMFFTLMH